LNETCDSENRPFHLQSEARLAIANSAVAKECEAIQTIPRAIFAFNFATEIGYANHARVRGLRRIPKNVSDQLTPFRRPSNAASCVTESDRIPGRVNDGE
jgi:hypothetical protein